MPCCGGLLVYPGQYKSPTGLEMKGCPIRLKEINHQDNPAPTRLRGAEVAIGNAIRRRVARMKAPSKCFGYKGEQCNPNLAYGPVFGFRQAPRFGSRCGDKGFRNIYSANHGDSSDVITWKRLYGGPRQLFSTKSCKYGCCGNTPANLTLPFGGHAIPGQLNNCLTYLLNWGGSSGSTALKIGDALWLNDGTTPNFYEAIVHATEPVVAATAAPPLFTEEATVFISDRSSKMGKYFQGRSAGPISNLSIYRRDILNQWKSAGTFKGIGNLT